MGKLNYKLLPEGSADGRIPLNLIYVDKKDINEAGILMVDACRAIARDFQGPAAIDILDMNAVTVTSDGIMADGAVVGFASADYGIINHEFGFMAVAERPYSQALLNEEPHMKQWDANYNGKRLYRGPSPENMRPRGPMNETQTITGRIANNNTGSEMMNIVDMTEILTPIYGMLSVMRDEEVFIGLAGPVMSVGIGMVVRERGGRIFGWSFGPGMTAHASGEYAKTVKSDYPALCGTKATLAEYTIRALEIGLVPGRELSSSPANLSLAHALGCPIDFDHITPDAWVELESVGFTRQMLSTPRKPLSREEVIARADEIVPGMEDGRKYRVSDISELRWAEY